LHNLGTGGGISSLVFDPYTELLWAADNTVKKKHPHSHFQSSTELNDRERERERARGRERKRKRANMEKYGKRATKTST
jgi:hypothetical protein